MLSSYTEQVTENMVSMEFLSIQPPAVELANPMYCTTNTFQSLPPLPPPTTPFSPPLTLPTTPFPPPLPPPTTPFPPPLPPPTTPFPPPPLVSKIKEEATTNPEVSHQLRKEMRRCSTTSTAPMMRGKSITSLHEGEERYSAVISELAAVVSPT